jgi:hypothetical protein
MKNPSTQIYQNLILKLLFIPGNHRAKSGTTPPLRSQIELFSLWNDLMACYIVWENLFKELKIKRRLNLQQ